MTIFVEKPEDLVGKTIKAISTDEYCSTILQLVMQFTDGTYGWIDVVNDGSIMNIVDPATKDAVLCEFGVISDEEFERRDKQHDENDKIATRKKELAQLARLKAKYETG